ncbi:MAG: HDOD domain-containing protein [Lachnospiraceae bacterium]|nr:HDOD domain-containing protein [Lachnospiraceae bacterium]
MLATLIPLFDDNLNVSGYSIFTQKRNLLSEPSFAGTARYDGMTDIAGLDLIESMGVKTLSDDREVFVEVNNVSIFSDISSQCSAPHEKIVLLIDQSVVPDDNYINRLKELKSQNYKLAIRKLPIEKFESYRPILSLMNYILLNHKKINIKNAKIYFGKIFPELKLVAVNVDTQEDFDKLKADGGYSFYEGTFFRTPLSETQNAVAPLKINYIELLNIINDADFDLTKAADVIGRDTALVISLLKMVNHMAVNSEITSVRHAAAMLGQKELKRWINTAVTKELCADRPSEIMRVSLLRAKFAENLAPSFEIAGLSSELFLMGLFSVLDVILEKPMEEALKMVKVSKNISNALINHEGPLYPVLNFIMEYENASWQEVSRLMLLDNIDMKKVYEAYISSLTWYRDLLDMK